VPTRLDWQASSRGSDVFLFSTEGYVFVFMFALYWYLFMHSFPPEVSYFHYSADRPML
jgi:hypothetical protein